MKINTMKSKYTAKDFKEAIIKIDSTLKKSDISLKIKPYCINVYIKKLVPLLRIETGLKNLNMHEPGFLFVEYCHDSKKTFDLFDTFGATKTNELLNFYGCHKHFFDSNTIVNMQKISHFMAQRGILDGLWSSDCNNRDTRTIARLLNDLFYTQQK